MRVLSSLSYAADEADLLGWAQMEFHEDGQVSHAREASDHSNRGPPLFYPKPFASFDNCWGPTPSRLAHQLAHQAPATGKASASRVGFYAKLRFWPFLAHSSLSAHWLPHEPIQIVHPQPTNPPEKVLFVFSASGPSCCHFSLPILYAFVRVPDPQSHMGDKGKIAQLQCLCWLLPNYP